MEKNTLYAKFKFEKQDEELVNILEDYINQNAERIFEFFDSSLEKKPLEIEIIPTKKEYDERQKERRGVDEIPKWSVGVYFDNKIEYVSFNDYQNTAHAYPEETYEESLEHYKKTIIHEFTHYVLKLYIEKHNNDEPLKYLNEGIAQYLSGQRDNQVFDFNYSLDDILKSQSCYPAWYLMVKYILEEYSRSYFLKLLVHNDLALSETPYLYEEAKEYYEELKQESVKSR